MEAGQRSDVRFYRDRATDSQLAGLIDQRDELLSELRRLQAQAQDLRTALQDLYDDWPGPDTEALQQARAALACGGTGGRQDHEL